MAKRAMQSVFDRARESASAAANTAGKTIPVQTVKMPKRRQRMRIRQVETPLKRLLVSYHFSGR